MKQNIITYDTLQCRSMHIYTQVGFKNLMDFSWAVTARSLSNLFGYIPSRSNDPEVRLQMKCNS
jgi:hypothetical protein